MAQGTPLRDPEKDRLLTPENAALLVIDYQPEQISTVASTDQDRLMMNVVTVARAAVSFGVPVVLTTVAVRMGSNSPTDDRLTEVLPDVPVIDRTSMNSWEDPEFRAAVDATGRRKLIMCGLWTEVCVAFPTVDAIAEGFEVYPVADAIGGVSRDSHDAAMQRVVQAGAHPVSALAVACELQRDWDRGHGDKLRTIMKWYFRRLAELAKPESAAS
ncbi:hydrolase [Actinomadura atramentaria]|uniref:hydrolase n=1 Tax=Actinomadura atramentaria TaxID=1990 RepID=UPI00037DB67E|nr:hydrolase [Actinomadura atramentaria]